MIEQTVKQLKRVKNRLSSRSKKIQ